MEHTADVVTCTCNCAMLAALMMLQTQMLHTGPCMGPVRIYSVCPTPAIAQHASSEDIYM